MCRYTYFKLQEERIANTQGRDQADDDIPMRVATTDGWHGTGTFPAENIYNDRQDGAPQRAGMTTCQSLPDWDVCCPQAS